MRTLLLLTVLAGITGYAWASGAIHFTNSIEYAAAQPASVVKAVEPTIDQAGVQIERMSLKEKVGQLFIAGHWDTESPSSTAALVRKHALGGVIIMRAPEEETLLSDWAQVWNASSTLPLLIAIDQEGGVVTRLKGKGYNLTPQREIESAAEALEIGRIRGAELAELGINTNFAPVLEASENPEAFLYNRTFGNSDRVAIFGKAMIAGMHQSGVIAVPKHYPGHEDTPVDSHEELPVLSVTEDEYTTHTRSFDNVIRYNNPYAMMTAHVLLPELDPQYPATLSKIILEDTLRAEAGFAGVIITDDMTMGAITSTYDPAEASVAALEAGADMILFAADPDVIASAITSVTAAIEDGTLSESRIDKSLERILEMKAEY